jgi:predicted aspartyl protease
LIEGWVRKDGCPVIVLTVGDAEWVAVIDTGFNGDLELPPALATHVQPQFAGRSRFILAAGQAIEEDSFRVSFPFDGMQVKALATFVAGNEILLGTRMLRNHTLNINFVTGKVTISRAS